MTKEFIHSGIRLEDVVGNFVKVHLMQEKETGNYVIVQDNNFYLDSVFCVEKRSRVKAKSIKELIENVTKLGTTPGFFKDEGGANISSCLKPEILDNYNFIFSDNVLTFVDNLKKELPEEFL